MVRTSLPGTTKDWTPVPEFKPTLHPTYYGQGVYNVTVDFDDCLFAEAGPLQRHVSSHRGFTRRRPRGRLFGVVDPGPHRPPWGESRRPGTVAADQTPATSAQPSGDVL